MRLGLLVYGMTLLILCCEGSLDDQKDTSTDTGSPPGSDSFTENRSDSENEPIPTDSSDTAPVEPVEIGDVLGIWAKDDLGESSISGNDCGAYWLIDFDYEHTLFEQTPAGALSVSFCLDESCDELEWIVDTYEWLAPIAKYTDVAAISATDTCEIIKTHVGQISFTSPDTGRFDWETSLEYVGSGCEQLKDTATQGDVCTATAGTVIRKN